MKTRNAVVQIARYFERAGFSPGCFSDREESRKAEEMARMAFRCFVLGEGFLFGKRQAGEDFDEK